MNWNLIGKILMKWSLDMEEYDLTFILYTEYNVGIPITYLYKLTKKKDFQNIDDFKKNHQNIKGDYRLNKILRLFTKSKYTRLIEYENIFGYKYI